MLRIVSVLVVLLCVTALTLMLLVGHGPWAGEPIWTLGTGHGLNSGDLLPLGLWATSVVACLGLWRRG